MGLLGRIGRVSPQKLFGQREETPQELRVGQHLPDLRNERSWREYEGTRRAPLLESTYVRRGNELGSNRAPQIPSEDRVNVRVMSTTRTGNCRRWRRRTGSR
jgi:hypothetical protein